MIWRTRAFSTGAGAALLSLALAIAALAGGRTGEAKDPLAAEIARWSVFLRTNTRTDENWTQVQQSSEPVIARAEEALRDGRRLLALQRLAAVRVNLAAAAYVGERPAGKREDPAVLEAEWARVGKALGGELGPVHPAELDAIRPAAVRALAEAALLQVRAYYDASLEYGRSTTPQSGLFYLGVAQAHREFVSFCLKLDAGSSRRSPPLRVLRGELDALEAELLAAYRPPASIDRHSDFIAVSALLKEARELDTACLRYGALLRYLQAVQRLAPLRPAAAPLDAAALSGRLKSFDERLSRDGLDHSLGRLFLEIGQAAASTASPPAGTPPAWPIVTDVLPRYFAALEPAPPAPAQPAPLVTVTLVRWPYT